MSHVHPPGRHAARFAAAFALVLVGTGVAIPAQAAAPGSPRATPPPTIPHKASPPAATPRPPLDMKTTRTSKTASQQVPATPPKQRQGVVPGQVLVTLDAATTVTGTAVPGTRVGARGAQTSSAQVNTQLHRFRGKSLRPLVRGTAAGTGLGQSYVLQTGERDSVAVARALRGTPGVALAEPDRYVNTMNSGGTALPKAVLGSFPKTRKQPVQKQAAQPQDSALPANDTVADSAQAFLNSGGVNAMGAFSLLQGRHGQQPGQGQIVTNVSIGDLTDQSMADAGDSYVKGAGPTTVVKDGQRYLDLPSMPLIPTYVAKAAGGLDPTGSTEGQDPELGEVLLDFSVMSPLAHDRQRPGATGSGYTDLLGIAPGAGYRLVVPEQPTMTQLAGTLLAAAHQSPRPNVITASLGFGTDTEGFPGRYLEDDPYIRSVVASIVREGTVVTISSNDGTRLYTPAAVGPDGGSTPTDLAPDERRATRIDDVAESTTPSRVPDSGAIAAGGTTLDDILAAGPGGSATTAETRISGEGTFSSGFGGRVTLSAPSDNILAFSHQIGGGAGDVAVSLSGGTSASAPEIAAAAAVVLQAGRISGRHLTPAAVRQILTSTGRAVPTPAQIDRTLQVGPQIDVTAAVQKVLGGEAAPAPQIVRLALAHRVTRGNLGGSFLETTDQNRIDLGDRASGGDGKALTGPITFAGDVTGATPRARYALSVGKQTFTSPTPAIRITPEQLLTAAGLPVVSTADRQVSVTYSVLEDGRTRASSTRTLTVGPSDGTTTEALAPKAPATVAAGKSVTVSYDLTGVAGTDKPQLVLSTVGHWNPVLAPVFTAAWHQELTDKKGTVTIPASAFTGGGGIYGIGTVQSGFDSANPRFTVYGEFAPVRVTGATAAERPDAPLLTGANGVTGHTAEVSRAASGTTVSYDVRGVPGAHAVQLEFATPGPTLYGTVNTFTNANGTQLDHDGVNSPSAYQQVLHDTHGTVKLDPARLGLSGSLVYGVRVLALDRSGHVIGQASPVSTLAFDDGLPPDGSGVLGFAAAGDHSVAALVTATGTEVRHYSTATGRYGAVITSDPGESYYQVVGATADRALLMHVTGDEKVKVETWDTRADKLVGSSVLSDDDGYFVTGQVDAARSRAALLLYSPGKNSVVPVDLNTGATGEPITINVSGNALPYGLLALDKASGQAYLTRPAGSFNCFGFSQAARVDLVARTVGYTGSISPCGYGSAIGGGKLYNLFANSISVNLVPTATLGPVDLATGTPGTATPVRLGKPLGLAVDDVHDLAVVAFPTPVGRSYYGSQAMVIPDNNPTGQLAVVDLKTGKTVRTLNGFLNGRHGPNDNLVQLDPSTRTGWTFGPYDAQIQQFTY